MAETIETIYKQIHLADGVFDIVPVQQLVRCRDCKYYDKFKGVVDGGCRYYGIYTNPDDFCSRGERKDESEDEDDL